MCSYCTLTYDQVIAMQYWLLDEFAYVESSKEAAARTNPESNVGSTGKLHVQLRRTEGKPIWGTLAERIYLVLVEKKHNPDGRIVLENVDKEYQGHWQLIYQ